MHNGLGIVILHKADQGPGEGLLFVHVLHQMLAVVYHWPQTILQEWLQTDFVFCTNDELLKKACNDRTGTLKKKDTSSSIFICMFSANWFNDYQTMIVWFSILFGCLSNTHALMAWISSCLPALVLCERQMSPSKSVTARSGASSKMCSATSGWSLSEPEAH